MGLQSSAHRLAGAHGSTRLEEGRQLPPAGQEERHRRVDRHHGGAEPQNLPEKKDLSETEDIQRSIGPMGGKK